MTFRRWTRRVLIGIGSVIALLAVVVALLQLSPVATWATRRLLPLVPLNPGYSLEVGGVSGNWFTALELRNVRLRHGRDVLARLDRVRAEFSLWQLRGPVTRLASLEIGGGEVTAHRTPDGWDVANALASSPDTAPAAGGSRFAVGSIDVRDIDITAIFAPDSVAQVQDLALRIRDLMTGDVTVLAIDTLGAKVAPPTAGAPWLSVHGRGAATPDAFHLDTLDIASGRSRIAGRAVLPRRWDDAESLDRMAVALDIAPLALADVAAWMPKVQPSGELRLAVRAAGDRGKAAGTITGELAGATIDLNGHTVIGTDAPVVIVAKGGVQGLDPAAVYRGAPDGRFNADLDVDLRGPTLRRVEGRAAFEIANVSGAPSAFEQLVLEATMDGDGRANVAMLAEAGARSGAPGPIPTVTASGWVRPFDSVPSYRLSGAVRHLPGTTALAQRLVGNGGDPTLVVRFDVTGRGLALDRVDATGRIDLVAERWDDDRVALGQMPVTVANGSVVARPVLSVAGGTIRAVATVHLGDTLRYTLRDGAVDSLDLGRLLEDTTAGALSGTFSGAGHGTTPDALAATVRFDLDRLIYAGRSIAGLETTLRLADGEAHLRAAGPLEGGRLALTASAQPFDSAVTFAIQEASVHRVDLGTLLGKPEYAGPVTVEATGHGRFEGDARSLQARILMQPSTLGRLQVSGGEMTAAMQGDRAEIEGAFHTSGGTIALAGTATGLGKEPRYRLERGRFDSLDLAAFTGQPGWTSRLQGTATASLTGQGIDGTVAELLIELDSSRVGDVAVRQGRLTLTADHGALRGGLAIESSDGRFESELALDAVTDSAGLATLGGYLTAAGTLGEARLDTMRIVLTPVAGAVAVDTAIVRSNIAVLDGAGEVALRPSAGVDTFRLTGFVRDLAPLAALAGIDTVLVDSAMMTLAVTGPAYQWEVTSEAEIERLLYAGRHAQRVLLVAQAHIDSNGVNGLAGELRVEDAAVGRTRVDLLTATARYDSLVAFEATAALPGDVRLAAALQGRVEGDTVNAMLTRLDLNEGGRTWALERPTRLVLRPRIEIDSLLLRSDDRQVAVNGVFDAAGTSDLTGRIDGLELGRFRELGLVPVPGRLDAVFHFAGTAAAPSLDARMALVLPQEVTAPGHIEADLRWDARGLELDAAAVPQDGRRLSVRGTLPWALSLASTGTPPPATDTLGLVVEADSFDLAFFGPLLPPAQVQEVHGTLAVDARIAGTPEVPTIRGQIALTNFDVTLPPLGVTYTNGEFVGHFSGDELRIARLRLGTDDDEELIAEGVIRFRPIMNPEFDLTARMEDFRLSNSAMLQASASGRLELEGTLEAPVLTGIVHPGHTEYFQGAQGTDVVVEEVELTEADRRELARHFGSAVLEDVNEGPGLMDRLRLDLKVEFERDVWFRRRLSPKADIEVAGNITVRQEPGGEMQFFGTVEPVPGRGFLDVYGRDFRLTGGEIVLAGPVDSARLDVTAEYQVPTQSGADDGIIVEVVAQGRPDSLTLDFSAEPSMSQEDIISYVVTGRPASEDPFAGEGGGAGEAGAKLAFGAISEQLSNAAGQSLGLDVFQIKQEGLRGLTLTAGRYIAPRVFLSIQQPIQLSAEGQQTPGTSAGPAFELEYTIQRWLRFNMRGGSVPPRFFFRSRYAY